MNNLLGFLAVWLVFSFLAYVALIPKGLEDKEHIKRAILWGLAGTVIFLFLRPYLPVGKLEPI